MHPARDLFSKDYREQLARVIEEKIEHGDREAGPPPRKQRPSDVVDLAAVLQKSIQETEHRSNRNGARKSRRKGKPRTVRARKKAA
jgi:non-homologous end joining protein Ku